MASSSCSISVPRIYPPSSYSVNSQNPHILKTLANPRIIPTSPKTFRTSSIAYTSLLYSCSALRSHGRRVFSTLHDSVPDSSEQSVVEKEDDVQSIEPNVDELIKAYKEAVLCGDDKTTCYIEAKLYKMENEKNELVHKHLSLQLEMASGKERYIRLQADFDNFRKRIEKEKLTTTSDAKGDVIESLLAMVNSFERAKQQIKTETDKEEKIDKSYQGIYKQFVEIMRSFKVSAVPTVGKPFDPSIHEAIAREESEEFKAGIVIQEIRRGFLLGNRLLRPATVKVSSGPAKKGVPNSAERSEQGAAVTVDES